MNGMDLRSDESAERHRVRPWTANAVVIVTAALFGLFGAVLVDEGVAWPLAWLAPFGWIVAGAVAAQYLRRQ